jgi:putative nucleotidyltransferase with HDIG domain
LWTGLASAAAMTGIGLMTNLDVEATLLRAGYVAISALISAVLAVGCLPLMESLFSITTQQKLLELSNPNQPLLRMLQIEAPGTYHHSLLVANLAEAAADAVGANALLCRVGAYYHDIGKAKRPMYFKENQMDEVNPHDSMSPQVSAAILAEHVRDGRVMAERDKLPKPIVAIIREHHGTTTMGYFLHRAKQQAEGTGEEVSEEDYRYDGPPPQTRESALVSLADTVEAAVRSLKDHSSDSMQTMIRKLLADRMSDGQLADVPLTIRDFSRIEAAFMHVLGGIYHTRVEYPELRSPKGKEEGTL